MVTTPMNNKPLAKNRSKSGPAMATSFSPPDGEWWYKRSASAQRKTTTWIFNLLEIKQESTRVLVRFLVLEERLQKHLCFQIWRHKQFLTKLLSLWWGNVQSFKGNCSISSTCEDLWMNYKPPVCRTKEHSIAIVKIWPDRITDHWCPWDMTGGYIQRPVVAVYGRDCI